MAISRVKTWVAEEVLDASDLNAEFDNIITAGLDLVFPATVALDLDGKELILDSDADTSITADTDDIIDIRIGGVDGIAFGHGSTNTGAFALFDPGAFTATANTSVGRVRVGNTNAVTVPAGTTAVAASLFVEEPNLTATGTITNAATVYIEAAPTEGGTGNFALWVDAGKTKLDGTLEVDGTVTEAMGTAIGDSDIDGSGVLTLPTDGNAFSFSGTEALVTIATVGVGTQIELHHTSARVLTHHATDLICIGGASITTASGDVSRWREYAAGDWRMTGYTLAAGGAISGLAQGTHTIFIPAAAMKPTVSNGCAVLTSVETTSGRPDMIVLDFDDAADEHAQFQIAMPKSWNEGTITFQVWHTTTATDTDGVAWGLQGVACSDGDTIDVAYGTPVVVTDAYQSTAEDLYVTAISSAVTIAGTPAAGDMCFFRIFRDVSDAADTATEDARLIGVQILFTINAGNDA
jgi:hypothetical protein